MGTMTRGFDFSQHAASRPHGAARHLAADIGLWVQRYCAGLAVPLQSRDGFVANPRAARTNPTTTSTISMIFSVSASSVISPPMRDTKES